MSPFALGIWDTKHICYGTVCEQGQRFLNFHRIRNRPKSRTAKRTSPWTRLEISSGIARNRPSEVLDNGVRLVPGISTFSRTARCTLFILRTFFLSFLFLCGGRSSCSCFLFPLFLCPFWWLHEMSFSTSELRARRTRGQGKRKKSVITVGDRAINQLTEVLY